MDKMQLRFKRERMAEVGGKDIQGLHMGLRYHRSVKFEDSLRLCQGLVAHANIKPKTGPLLHMLASI